MFNQTHRHINRSHLSLGTFSQQEWKTWKELVVRKEGGKKIPLSHLNVCFPREEGFSYHAYMPFTVYQLYCLGAPPKSWILVLLCDLACALDHLHGNAITHGDLTSANVFWSGQDFKLGDLDHSHHWNSSPLPEKEFGTVIYWPLEKLLGVAENTMKYAAAADIWALGCVVSEFLLQFHPFSPPTSSRSNCYDKEEEEEEEGVGEVQVLSLIYKLLGPPPASMAQNMLLFDTKEETEARKLDKFLRNPPTIITETLKECWNYDLNKRITAKQLKEMVVGSRKGDNEEKEAWRREMLNKVDLGKEWKRCVTKEEEEEEADIFTL